MLEVDWHEQEKTDCSLNVPYRPRTHLLIHNVRPYQSLQLYFWVLPQQHSAWIFNCCLLIELINIVCTHLLLFILMLAGCHTMSSFIPSYFLLCSFTVVISVNLNPPYFLEVKWQLRCFELNTWRAKIYESYRYSLWMSRITQEPFDPQSQTLPAFVTLFLTATAEIFCTSLQLLPVKWSY